MIRGVAIDLASRAITVNNVQPGPTATDMTVGHAEILIPLIPLGRMGEPDEIGGLLPKGLSQAVAVYNVVAVGTPLSPLLRVRRLPNGRKSALPRRWRACRRRTGIHPTVPVPTGIANGRYRAGRAVPAARAEWLTWVDLSRPIVVTRTTEIGAELPMSERRSFGRSCPLADLAGGMGKMVRLGGLPTYAGWPSHLAMTTRGATS